MRYDLHKRILHVQDFTKIVVFSDTFGLEIPLIQDRVSVKKIYFWFFVVG